MPLYCSNTGSTALREAEVQRSFFFSFPCGSVSLLSNRYLRFGTDVATHLDGFTHVQSMAPAQRAAVIAKNATFQALAERGAAAAELGRSKLI